MFMSSMLGVLRIHIVFSEDILLNLMKIFIIHTVSIEIRINLTNMKCHFVDDLLPPIIKDIKYSETQI